MTDSSKVPGWRLLWSLIRYAPRLYSIDSLFWIAIESLPALSGLAIREFFDALTGTSRLPVGVAIALLLGVAIAHIAVILAGRLTKTQHRFLVSGLVRRNLLAQLLQRPGAAPLAANDRVVSTGEAISYFREDADQIEDAVAGVSEIAGSGLFALFALVMLLSIDAQITLLVFVPLAVIVVVVQRAQTRIKRYRRASRRATEQVTGMTNEMFHRVQAIKVAGAEDHVLDHFRQMNDQRRVVMIRDRLLSALLESGFQNLISFGTGLILLVAAQAIQAEQTTLTVGELALFIYYLGYITSFFTFLGESIALYQQTEVSFERMGMLLPEESALAVVAHQPLYVQHLGGQPPPLPPLPQPDRIPLTELRAEGLSYDYPQTRQGITDVSLQLARGSLTVITGRIGAGKTTLLRVLLGLLPRQSGEIYWNDRPIPQPATFFVPPQSAYTPQTPQLFSDTLLQNLLLGNSLDAALAEAIDLAVFESDLAAMPDGLHTVVGARGMRLSGGQMQRAAAARMFVRRPELLVFDDLSSALDIDTELKLWARLFEGSTRSNWAPTCLVVSHRRPVLQRADRILVLDRGRVIASGSFATLSRQPELNQLW